MATRHDPPHAAEIGLRARIERAGPAGYLVDMTDVDEVLAMHDLHRRGLLEPTGEPWRYRLRPIRGARPFALATQNRRR